MGNQFGPLIPITNWNGGSSASKSVASYDMQFVQVVVQINQALAGARIPERPRSLGSMKD